MAIANTLRHYLAAHHFDYEIVRHHYSVTGQHTAEAAHVSGNQLAKSVILEDADGYVMAVLPASHQLDPVALNSLLNRSLTLSTEAAFAALFHDCELGAIPALGSAYGIATVVDNLLFYPREVFIEAGDHQTLLRIDAAEFRRLMSGATTGNIGSRAS